MRSEYRRCGVVLQRAFKSGETSGPFQVEIRSIDGRYTDHDLLRRPQYWTEKHRRPLGPNKPFGGWEIGDCEWSHLDHQTKAIGCYPRSMNNTVAEKSHQRVEIALAIQVGKSIFCASFTHVEHRKLGS